MSAAYLRNRAKHYLHVVGNDLPPPRGARARWHREITSIEKAIVVGGLAIFVVVAFLTFLASLQVEPTPPPAMIGKLLDPHR